MLHPATRLFLVVPIVLFLCQPSFAASVSDGGTTTLTIALGTNESLTAVSNGATYTFTLAAGTFTNGTVANTGDFTAFGAISLTLQASGLTRYSTIAFTDSGSGATVTFGNSGANTFTDSILITLTDGSSQVNVTSANTFPGFSVVIATNVTVQAGITVTGAGVCTLVAEDDVSVTETGSITTNGGSVALQGGTGATDDVLVDGDVTTNGGRFAALATNFTIDDDGDTISTAGGKLEIQTNTADIDGTNPTVAAIDAGNGDVFIYRVSVGTVGLGQAAGQLQINQAELDQIKCDALTIGDPDNSIMGDDLTGHSNQVSAIALNGVDFTDNGAADQGVDILVRLFALNGSASITFDGNNLAPQLRAEAANQVIVNSPGNANPTLLSEFGVIHLLASAIATQPGIDIAGAIQSQAQLQIDAFEVRLNATLTAPGGLDGSAFEITVVGPGGGAKIADAFAILNTGTTPGFPGTINIGNGTYNGGLTVPQANVILIGGTGAIIAPTSPGFTINTTGVTIDGFSYSGTSGSPALLVTGSANNVTIKNGNITGTTGSGAGILVDNTVTTAIAITIDNVAMNGVVGHGVHFQGALTGANVDIVNGDILGAQDGVHFDMAINGAADVTISGNDIEYGPLAGNRGIEVVAGVAGTAKLAISSNVIDPDTASTGDDGILVNGGVSGSAAVEIVSNLIALGAGFAGTVPDEIGAAIDIQGGVLNTASVLLSGNTAEGNEDAVQFDGTISTTSSALTGGYGVLITGQTMQGLNRHVVEFTGPISGAKVGINDNPLMNISANPAANFGLNGIHFAGTISSGAQADILRNTSVAAADHGVSFGDNITGAVVNVNGNGLNANLDNDATGAGIFFAGTVTNSQTVIDGNTIASRGDGLTLAGAVTGDATLEVTDNDIGTVGTFVSGDGIRFIGGILSTATVMVGGGGQQIFANGQAIDASDLQSPSTLSIGGGTYQGAAGSLLVDNTGVPGTDGRLEIGTAGFVAGAGIPVFQVLTDSGNAGVDIDLNGNATLSGGSTGMILSGPGVDLDGNSLGSIAFSGQSGDFIQLQNGALFDPGNPTLIDAANVDFDGLDRSLFAEAQTIEGRLVHYPDIATLGLIDLGPSTPGDLLVEKSVSDATIVAGATMVYSVTATNLGPGIVYDVTMEDTLPANVVFISSTTGCIHNLGVVSCTFTSLLASQVATVTVEVMVDPLTVNPWALNTATLFSATDNDPFADNNVAMATSEVFFPPHLTCTDILANNDPGVCEALLVFDASVEANPALTALDFAVGGMPIASPFSFPVGDTIVDCTAANLVGEDTCSFTVTVVDSESPVAQCQPALVSLDSLGSVTITATSVDGGSTDNCGIATISVSPDTFTCADVGMNTVTLTVTDANLNSATCSTTVTVIDDILPTALCQAATVTLSATGYGVIAAASVDGGSFDNCGIASLVLSTTEFGCAEVGINEVTLTVLDVNGLISQCTGEVLVIDASAPTVICQDITVELDSVGFVSLDPMDVDASSFDNCAIVSMSVSPAWFDCTGVGANPVVLSATDASGNSATCTATVTVVDMIPPSLSCSDMTTPTDPGECGAIVSYNLVVTDNCPGTTVVCDPPDNSFFAPGPSTVTCVATDASGNAASCTFVVEVVDSELPSAICQTTSVFLNELGNATLDPMSVDGGSSDNCGIQNILVDPQAFTCADLGIQDVTLTVTDTAGNVAFCTTTVEVIDDTEPVITLPTLDPIVADGTEAVVPDYTGLVTVTDNCTTVNDILVGQNPPPGTRVGSGATDIVLTATDESGNVGSATGTLQVDLPTPTPTASPTVTATPTATETPFMSAQNCDSGYYVLDSLGGRHRVGNPLLIAGPVYFGTDVARDMERLVCSPITKLLPGPQPDLAVLDSYGAVHIVANPACTIPQEFYFGGEAFRAVDLVLATDSEGCWVLSDNGSIYRAGSAKDPSDPALLTGTDLGLLGTDVPLPDRDPNLTPGGVTLRAVSLVVIDDDLDSRAEGYIVLDSMGGRFYFNADGSQVAAGSSSGLTGNEPGRLLDPTGYVWPFFLGLDVARDMELHPSQGGLIILDGWDGIHPVPVDIESNPVFFANNVISATDSTPAQAVGMPYVVEGFDDPTTPGDETQILDIDGASIFADLEFSAGCPDGGLYTLDRFGGVFVLGTARPDVNQPIPDFTGSPYFFPFLYAEDMELFGLNEAQPPDPTPTPGGTTKFGLFAW